VISYRCISADPPWNERGGGKIVRGAQRHYPLMKTPDITAAMLQAPQWRPDRDGCHMWLWVTDNYLRDGVSSSTISRIEGRTDVCR